MVRILVGVPLSVRMLTRGIDTIAEETPSSKTQEDRRRLAAAAIGN
jgi:hypothetical protein